jgi:hypothetical protein
MLKVFAAYALPNQYPKSEARNPKQTETLKSKIQNQLVWNLCFLSFGFVSNFGFRAFSGFSFLGGLCTDGAKPPLFSPPRRGREERGIFAAR